MIWTEEQVRALHREHLDDGVSLAAIGRRLGVSREAVRQQFAHYKLSRHSRSRHSTEQRLAGERAADEQRERIIELYKEHGTVDAVVAIVELPRRPVSAIINTIPNRQMYRRQGTQISYSREELCGFLRQAAEYAGEPLTIPGYREAAVALGLPSYNTHIRHFSREDPDTPWQTALKVAGVRWNEPRGRRGATVTAAQRSAALRLYMAENGGDTSYQGYSDWAAGRDDVPSGSNMRAIRPWNEIVAQALDTTHGV